MNGGARSSQRPKAVSKRVQNQSEILQRAANVIAFGDWLERSFWSSPSDDICLLTVCKIHTQLAKATSLGGGRPACVTNGRPPARSGGTETTGEVYVENVRRSNRQGGGVYWSPEGGVRQPR